YPIFASDTKTTARLYDYSPYLSLSTGVSGGRFLEGVWPALARQAWVETLRLQPLSRLDYSGHTNLVEKTQSELKKALSAPGDPDTDYSITGLQATAPL